jgi:hypothetical protein
MKGGGGYGIKTFKKLVTSDNDPTKDIRGLDVMDSDFSIIQVKHNITETANSIDLGMFVDPGVTINMTNDTKLQNDWYLNPEIPLIDNH